MQTMPHEAMTRLLHHVTRMPVSLYAHGARILSFPAEIPSADLLLRSQDPLEGLHVSQGQLLRPQYIASAFGERYLYFALDEVHALLIGAFLSEPMESKAVYTLLRTQHLPISAHQSLCDYFQGLIIADETQHFYLGRLLEVLHQSARRTAVQPDPVSTGNIGKLMFENTYENRMEMFSHPPYFLEQEMIRHIAGGDRKNAVRILSEINALNRATLARDPLRSLKNSLICSCTLFTRAAISGGAPSDAAFTLSDSFIQTMEDVHDLGTLDAMEEQMVLAFVDLVEQRVHERVSPVTRAAVEYIDDHLADKLTLPVVAEAVYVHPSYLSGRFKQDMGVPISEFIQRRRIEEAKHFVRHTNSSITEIATFYQFCSQSHFIQVFKRYTGMTPMQYRRDVI